MAQPLAAVDLVAVHPDGRRIPIRWTIGHPAPATDGEWTCAVGLGELYPDLPSAHGVDAMQALSLGLSLSLKLLGACAEHGITLLDAGGEPFLLEAYEVTLPTDDD